MTITGIDYDGDERRGLIANIESPIGRHKIALLELDLEPGQARQLVDADRMWLGHT